MISLHLGQPMKPLSSFLAYASGDEKVELKAAWASLLLPSTQTHDRKAA